MPPMDFYPLDSLQPKELRSELRQLNCKLCYELLEFDPEKRISAEEALEHPYFRENPPMKVSQCRPLTRRGRRRCPCSTNTLMREVSSHFTILVC